MKKIKQAVPVKNAFDLWLEQMVAHHKAAAARGTWDGKQVTEYYSECRKLHFKQGLSVVLTRDVGYCDNGRFERPSLNNCFNLSVASFSTVSMMPEAQRQELAIKIVMKMFWPDARQVWVEKPDKSKGFAGDIWHYLMFSDSNWRPQRLASEDREELLSKGLIPFQQIVREFVDAEKKTA